MREQPVDQLYAPFTVKQYGKATVVCDKYTDRSEYKRQRSLALMPPDSQIRLLYQLQQNFQGTKEDFLANIMNKQVLIKLIADCMQQKGCHVIHAEGDAHRWRHSESSCYYAII